MNSIENKVVDIIDNYYNYLLNLQNVTGLGYGYKYVNYKNTFEPCIAVFVKNKIDIRNLSKNNIIPKRYMGINTDVVEIEDEILKDDISSLNTELRYLKVRPLECGCSIGAIHLPGVSGTMCCIVKKLEKLKYNYYILSNNHVLADFGSRPIGTIYTQPAVSKIDYTRLKNSVAILETFVPIEFIKEDSDTQPLNSVDCAIARIIDKSLISSKIIGIGNLKGSKQAKIGMKVKKVGVRTGLTYGEISYVNFMKKIVVNNRERYMEKQILSKLETNSGDSGAPILTEKDNYIVAMNASRTKVAGERYSMSSDINIVLKKLKVKLHLG